MAYVNRTHGARPHAKFQPPTMTGLAVHKGHTTGQNKGNANIYVDEGCNRILMRLGCVIVTEYSSSKKSIDIPNIDILD